MIEVNKRKAVFSEIKGYCCHAGDNDYMEVTQWSNGEGYADEGGMSDEH
jgi:hypothetical protein